MSFYHILPSDSAKDRFPNNKAAQFSIPIDGAQHLDGQWEVAVAQLSFSNCLYTFALWLGNGQRKLSLGACSSIAEPAVMSEGT